MGEKTEQVLMELEHCPCGMISLVKGLKTGSEEVDGGRCMRGSDRKLCFSEKEGGKVWIDYMERIMNDESDWDQNVEGNAVEGPVVCGRRYSRRSSSLWKEIQ